MVYLHLQILLCFRLQFKVPLVPNQLLLPFAGLGQVIVPNIVMMHGWPGRRLVGWRHGAHGRSQAQLADQYAKCTEERGQREEVDVDVASRTIAATGSNNFLFLALNLLFWLVMPPIQRRNSAAAWHLDSELDWLAYSWLDDSIFMASMSMSASMPSRRRLLLLFQFFSKLRLFLSRVRFAAKLDEKCARLHRMLLDLTLALTLTLVTWRLCLELLFPVVSLQ